MKTNLSLDNFKIAFESKSDQDLRFSAFIFKIMSNKIVTDILIILTKIALFLRLPISFIIQKTVFKQFCGGETINESLIIVEKLGQSNIQSILDYSIEGENNEKHFEHTKDEIIRISNLAKNNPNIPVTCIKLTGIGRFETLEKASSGNKLDDKTKGLLDKLILRIDEICFKCAENNTPIYIDAEESWIQPEIDRISEQMMLKYNSKRAIVFNTLQMYRWDRIDYLNKLISFAQENNIKLGLKIVRGAYLETENERAKDMGYKTPIQPNKEATDNDYDKALKIIIENIDLIEVCAGTHNEKSSILLTDLMKEKNLPNNHSHIYFSQLYGMSDHISYNLSNAGYNVSKYLPYGPIKSTVPYLIRRAQENTAIAGQIGKELNFILQEQKRRKQEN